MYNSKQKTERIKVIMKKLSLIQKIKQIKSNFNLTSINDPALNQKLQQVMQLAPQMYTEKEDLLLVQVMVQTIQTKKTLSTIKLADFLYNTVFKVKNAKVRVPFVVNMSVDYGQSFTQDYMDSNVKLHLVQSIAERDLFILLNKENNINTIRHVVSTEPIKNYLIKKFPDKKEEFEHIKKFQFNTAEDQLFDGDDTNQLTVHNHHITFTAHLTLALTQFEQQNNIKNQYYQDILNSLHGYPLNIGWTAANHNKVQLFL